MPTYEYKCGHCGRKFEEFQKMTDPPITSCRFCHKNVERMISGGSGMLFRGSGFYITDYRSDNYKKAAKGDSVSTSATSKSDNQSKEKKTQPEKKPAS